MSDEIAPEPYPPLFERYRNELRSLHDQLQQEKETVIKRLMAEEGLNKEEAENFFTSENGPLVHDARVIHLIRKYWLKIYEMKKERIKLEEYAIEPLTFLVEDLYDNEEDELAEFLTEIAYWPVGLDENNEWS